MFFSPPPVRYDIGSILEAEGFTEGVELGYMNGVFANNTLTRWAKARKYYMLDLKNGLQNITVGTDTGAIRRTNMHMHLQMECGKGSFQGFLSTLCPLPDMSCNDYHLESPFHACIDSFPSVLPHVGAFFRCLFPSLPAPLKYRLALMHFFTTDVFK